MKNRSNQGFSGIVVSAGHRANIIDTPDMRREMQFWREEQINDSSDDDDDFVTPVEVFESNSNSGKSKKSNTPILKMVVIELERGLYEVPENVVTDESKIDKKMIVDKSWEIVLHEQSALYKSGTLHAIMGCEAVIEPGLKDTDITICGVGDEVVHNSQSRVDEEIEKHFEEDTYMISFEHNLKEFDDVYGRCLNNFEVVLALYPQNPRLAQLKKLTPKNLHAELDGSSNTPKKRRTSLLRLTGKRQLVVNEVLYNEKDAHQKFGETGNVYAEMAKPRRELKASHLCRSPYMSRVIDVSNHVMTTEEKNVWQWLFQNRRNRKKNLFEWNDRMCTKAHFHSLHENKMVMSTLIDTWTYVLNENEILKADSSPLRLFLTTETTYGSLQIGDKLGRYAAFCDNMDLVIQMVSEMHNREYEVTDFDMFVFPIYSSGHYYIICYNIKKASLEIIDNRVPTDGVEETYADLRARLDNQKTLLNKLRIIYCHSILTWSENRKRTVILEGAANFAKGRNMVT
ncbi:hypothetical protein AgCh_038891 [Apium graveolens]